MSFVSPGQVSVELLQYLLLQVPEECRRQCIGSTFAGFLLFSVLAFCSSSVTIFAPVKVLLSFASEMIAPDAKMENTPVRPREPRVNRMSHKIET
jgi:hypothetical protein